MTSRTKKILAVTVSTLLTLLLAELALRVLDASTSTDFFHVMRNRRNTSEKTRLKLVDTITLSRHDALIFELAPGTRGEFQGAPLAINDAGHVGPPVGPQRATPDTKRLLVLGDSNAFGWAVPYEKSLVALAAARWKRDHGAALEVLNTAIPGYNTFQEAAALKIYGPEFKPDAILLVACRNDAGMANFLHVPSNPLALDRSFLVDLITVRIKSALRGAKYRNSSTPKGLGKVRNELGEDFIDFISPEQLEKIPPRYRERVGREAVMKSLASIAETAKSFGAPVVVAYIRQGGEDPLAGPMLARCRELGFGVVDIKTPVEALLKSSGRDYADLRVFPHDDHPSLEYHALLGKEIYEQQLKAALEAQ